MSGGRISPAPLPSHPNACSIVPRWYLDRDSKVERYEHVIYSQTRTLYRGGTSGGLHLGLTSILHWPYPGVVQG